MSIQPHHTDVRRALRRISGTTLEAAIDMCPECADIALDAWDDVCTISDELLGDGSGSMSVYADAAVDSLRTIEERLHATERAYADAGNDLSQIATGARRLIQFAQADGEVWFSALNAAAEDLDVLGMRVEARWMRGCARR